VKKNESKVPREHVAVAITLLLVGMFARGYGGRFSEH
jgi:hypothetical protein